METTNDSSVQENQQESQVTPSVTSSSSVSQKHMSILAIVALILSIIISPVGLILGIIALIRINKNSNLGGKGLAIASIIIGVILTIISIGIQLYFNQYAPV